MKVSFTNEVIDQFKEQGIYSAKFLSEISEKVKAVPRGAFDVDSSDDSISVLGKYISFVRDWNSGLIIIMTNGEAQRLDMYDAFQKGTLF